MITPDAKCINNGKKLNQLIKAVNSIILDTLVSEELDVVDSNNQASKRWFAVGKMTGQKQDSGSSNRDSLDTVGGGPDNRDKLNTSTISGIPREDGTGGAKGVFGGGGGPAGIPRADGTGGDNGYLGGDAPAGIPREDGTGGDNGYLGGDETSTPTTADAPAEHEKTATHIGRLSEKLVRERRKLRDAKKNQPETFNKSTGKWEKVGAPIIQATENRIKILEKQIALAKTNREK